jgi:hypothetical protein
MTHNVLIDAPGELAVLLKHWVNEAIDDEYFIFRGQCDNELDLKGPSLRYVGRRL